MSVWRDICMYVQAHVLLILVLAFDIHGTYVHTCLDERMGIAK